MPEHRQERAASVVPVVPAVAREPQHTDRHPDRYPDYAQSVEYRKGTSRGAARLPHGFVLDPHSHTRGQLVYAASGALATATARGTWVAPANRVTWTPPRFAHSHRFYGETDVRLLTVPLDLCGQLVDHPSVFAVSPLLREALLALTGGKERRPGAHGRLLTVLVDELADAAEQSLHLPEASDDRLRAVTALLHEDPARPATLAALGRTVGASERTLSRLFHAELGMSFHRWRTTLRIHHALAHLAAGMSVTDTAVVCGWSNPSTFIDAFTEMVGQTPGRYRAGLRGGRP